ncbi:hypothetical protein niasHT_010601 [Heterodera trifolii]
MDKNIGLYNEEEDTMTFKAKVKAVKPFLTRDVSADDTLLLNGQINFVNKYILAAQSNFFKALFFGENADETPKIEIYEMENAEKCFEQLISVINSPNAAVYEDCVENVLQLSKQFNLSAVEINRCRGQILFKVTEFSSFPEVYNFEKKSDEVSIGGMPWQISIQRYSDAIGYIVYKVSPRGIYDLNFEAAVEFGTVSASKSNEWLMRQGNLEWFRKYSSWDRCRHYEKYLDPANGVYDEKEDAITFKAEIIVKTRKKEPIIEFQAEDKLLVNGQVVNVNKYLLAAHSEFFKILFFEFNEKMPKIEIGNDENAVGNFEKLISLVNSPSAELDDNSVENVLLLADRFQLASVLNRCANFLVKKSKKPFIHKYLLAHQYNIIGVKKELCGLHYRITAEEYFSNVNYLIEKFKIDEKALKENNLKKIYEYKSIDGYVKRKDFYQDIIILLEHLKFDAELVDELKDQLRRS